MADEEPVLSAGVFVQREVQQWHILLPWDAGHTFIKETVNTQVQTKVTLELVVNIQ